MTPELFFSATAATSILNIGHWESFVTRVARHTPGTDRFEYYDQKYWGDVFYKPNHDLYYLENKLQFLDQETEWFYNKDTRRLHLKTRSNRHPCELRVQARVQEYAFRICNTQYLTLRDLTFFGTTVWAATLGFKDSLLGMPVQQCHDCS